MTSGLFSIWTAIIFIYWKSIQTGLSTLFTSQILRSSQILKYSVNLFIGHTTFTKFQTVLLQSGNFFYKLNFPLVFCWEITKMELLFYLGHLYSKNVLSFCLLQWWIKLFFIKYVVFSFSLKYVMTDLISGWDFSTTVDNISIDKCIENKYGFAFYITIMNC